MIKMTHFSAPFRQFGSCLVFFLTLHDEHNIYTLLANIKFICTRCERGLNYTFLYMCINMTAIFTLKYKIVMKYLILYYTSWYCVHFIYMLNMKVRFFVVFTIVIWLVCSDLYNRKQSFFIPVEIKN
jgi:hypothetical protein